MHRGEKGANAARAPRPREQKTPLGLPRGDTLGCSDCFSQLLQCGESLLVRLEQGEVLGISEPSPSEVVLHGGYLPRQRPEQAPPVALLELAIFQVGGLFGESALIQNLFRSLAGVIVH